MDGTGSNNEKVLIDPETKKRVVAIFSASVISGLFVLFVMGFFFIPKQVVVNNIPDNLWCQPFKTKQDQEAENKILEQEGYKPVMSQMLVQAFEGRSKGKGELLEVTREVCFTHIGQRKTIPAKTFYYRKVSVK